MHRLRGYGGLRMADRLSHNLHPAPAWRESTLFSPAGRGRLLILSLLRQIRLSADHCCPSILPMALIFRFRDIILMAHSIHNVYSLRSLSLHSLPSIAEADRESV